MHLSLIGITVIPGRSACVKCGNITLKELHNEEFDEVKKLVRSKDGLGNLGRLAAVTASFCASEVIRLLVKSERMLPAMLNRRAEFNYISNELHFVELQPREGVRLRGPRKGRSIGVVGRGRTGKRVPGSVTMASREAGRS